MEDRLCPKYVRTTRPSKRVPMTLQLSLEPRLLQIVPVFMVAMMIIYVLYFADDQFESRSVLLLCLQRVTSHSIVVT